MSTFKILPQIEDEVLEVEIIDSQIEELTKLQEYDYFWKTLSILCWDNKDFMNRRFSLIDKIDKKIKHENRLCLYILLLPFIIVIGILRFIKKLITCFLVTNNFIIFENIKYEVCLVNQKYKQFIIGAEWKDMFVRKYALKEVTRCLTYLFLCNLKD